MEDLEKRIDRLVRKNIAFVVLKPDTKIPSITTFDITRMPTEKEIEEYKKCISFSNLGIFCGPVNHFWVLDIDNKEGEEFVKSLDLPKTLTVKTPRGYHLYWAWNDVLKTKIKAREGIDIKANGYIVGVGSNINGFEYEVVRRLPIATFPKEKLSQLYAQEKTNGEIKCWWEDALNGVDTGNRNATAAKLAGYLFAKAIPKEMVLSMMAEWDKKNKPPLGQDEIKTVIQSIFRYHKNEDLITVREALSEARTEIVEFMEPRSLVQGGIHLIVGSRGVGKTFFSTQLAAALAGQSKFLDLNVRNCKVLFIQKEIPFEVFKSERIKVFDSISNKDNMIFFKQPYKLRIDNGLVDIIEKSNCDVFFLDPLKLFWGYSLDEQKKSIDILFDLCNNKGKTAVIVHHYRKVGTGEGDKINNLDSVAGLGDWTDLATTVISLTETYDTQDFTLYMEFKKVRFCDKYDGRLLPKFIRLNKETLMFEVTEVTVKDKILGIISAQYPKGIKQADIVDLSGASPSMVSKTISYLIQENKIDKHGKTIILRGE